MNPLLLAGAAVAGWWYLTRARRNPDDNPNHIVEDSFQRLMELCEEIPSKERTAETKELNARLKAAKPYADPDIWREFERQYREVKRMNS